MSYMKALFSVAGALLISGIIFTPMSQAATYQLAENQPPEYPTTIGDREFAKLVKERTDGRIAIDVYDSAQLFDEKSSIEALQMGGLAFARVNAQPLSEFTRILGVLSLPYVFRDEDHLWKVLNGSVGEELFAEMESNGIIGLTYYDSGSRHFYNNKREIKTPADMKNLKIRVQQSKLMMGLVGALGASATPMAYGEVFTGLQSGVIDGAENNWPSYFSTSHYEVAPFYTLDYHTRTPEILCMSKAVWSKLSVEDRKIIKEAAIESQAKQREEWKAYEAKAIKAIRDSGKVTITEVTDFTPWKEAVKPVYDETDLGPKKNAFLKKIADIQ